LRRDVSNHEKRRNTVGPSKHRALITMCKAHSRRDNDLKPREAKTPPGLWEKGNKQSKEKRRSNQGEKKRFEGEKSPGKLRENGSDQKGKVELDKKPLCFLMN